MIFARADSVFFRVLIYPYWNVNITHAAQRIDNVKVLIYPYWNVNTAMLLFGMCDGQVLIYPYWNVNLQSATA